MGGGDLLMGGGDLLMGRGRMMFLGGGNFMLRCWEVEKIMIRSLRSGDKIL